MNIDVNDYVARWEINYIVYHSGHLREYGDPESANTYFSAQYQQQRDKMDNSQATLIQESIKSKTPIAAKGLEIAGNLENGTLLQETLDQIAAGINQGIDIAGGQINFDNYNSILQEARSFNNMLASRQTETQRINQFFNFLLQGLEQAKLLDLNILNALTNIGTQLAGTGFQIDASWENKVVALSEQDAILAQNVVNSLSRAVERLGANGTVSSRSFANTISYIFNRVIGGRIGQIIIAEGINIGVNTADSLLDKLIAQSGGKLSWVDRNNSQSINNSNGAINIFDSEGLQLRVIKGNQNFDIEIGTNISTKFQNSRKSNLRLAAIGRSTVGEYFSGQPEKYLAYNMIAHRYTGAVFEEAFNNIKAFTAASFFNDWIQKGGLKSSSGQPAQFLIINGRVYSVARIISNICDDIMRNGGQGAFEIQTFGQHSNKWQGTSPSWEAARKRSDMVNEVINKLTIAGTLNNNILLKYAY